jgi:hypothetical protein
MLVYVVIASSDGMPLDPAIVERIAQPDLPEIPFNPDQYLTWTNASGTVHFSGWQAFSEVGQIGSHWHTDEQTLTAFSGLPARLDGAWPAGRTVADSLSDTLATTSYEQLFEDLHGMYTFARIDQSGEGIVTSDPLSVAMLYHAELPGVQIVSNRANLAARAITPPGHAPYRDWRSAAWMIYSGQSYGLATGFSGVSVLPQSSYLRIHRYGRAEVRVWDQIPWEYPEGATRPSTIAGAIDELDGYLRSVLRSLARLPFQRRELRLSGGKDSRVLLALLLSEQLQDNFTILTYGHRDGFDPTTAIDLGRRLGFHVEFDDRSELDTDELHRRILIHTHQVAGTASAWDIKGDTLVTDDLRISGSMNAHVRPAPVSRALTETGDHPRTVIDNLSVFDKHKLLREPVSAYFRAQIDAHVDDILALLANPGDYGLIHSNRVSGRRWEGLSNEICAAPWSLPYFDHRAIRPMFQVSPLDRISERVPFEIMRRACPELAELPFVGGVWPPEAYAHDPGAAAIAQVKPVGADGARRSTHWRVANFSEHSAFFDEYLSDRSNPLYEIADRDKILAMLHHEPPSAATVLPLYAILTGAIWLGGHERHDRIKRFHDAGHTSYDLGLRRSLLRRRSDLPRQDGTGVPAIDPVSRSASLVADGPGPALSTDARICALIPHFRAERYLASALDSLVKQTRPLQAIVVIDDASETPPREIVERFPGVTLLQSPISSGPYRLVQQVIDDTDFDAYLFQDADDWSAPERLELLLAEAVRTGAELVGSQGYRLLVEEGEAVPYHHPLDPHAALRDSPKSKPVHHPTTLVSRDLIQRVGGFGTGFRYSGDAEFLRRAGYVARLANVPDPLYVYRTRSDSLTGSEETGNHTPVRRRLWELQHDRARYNAERREAQLPPLLDPMAVTSPIRLEHITGPPLNGTEQRKKPATRSIAPEVGPTHPVFIIGAPRSGTSLLALSLAQHPAFAWARDTGWITHLVESLHRLHGEHGDDRQRLEVTIAGAGLEAFVANFGHAVTDLILGGLESSWHGDFDTRFDVASPPRSRSNLPARRRWLAEGNDLSGEAFALTLLFPEARFIHVFRDPAEVVQSLAGDNARWYRSHHTDVTEQEAYALWTGQVQRCEQVERAFGARQVMRVDRNELVDSPRKTLGRVLCFLGEQFDEAALRPFD